MKKKILISLILIILLFQSILPIVFASNTYEGNINSEIKQINLNKNEKGAHYVSGEIIVVEWVNGKSTVPSEKPIMRFKSTDGKVDIEVFVTATGTNTYYFDRFIEGIDVSKDYVFEVASGSKNNISKNRAMNVYFSGTKFNDTIIGKYKDQRIKLKNQQIIFEEDTYVGNINSEIKQINLNKNEKGAHYVSGEIIVVEWVNGKSTVPSEKPIMRFKSTDGKADIEVFVTATGTNTYYFDRFIEGIDTSKTYIFEISSGDKRNISKNKKMNVYFKGDFLNKIIGAYGIEKMVKLENNSIKFKNIDSTYPIIMNSDEVEIFNLINAQRKGNGLPALKIDSRLQLLARVKAEDLVYNNYFSHVSKKYGLPYDMMQEINLQYVTCGENIAMAPQNFMAVNLWMNSSGHKANILNINYDYTGIGVIGNDKYNKKFVQMFIKK